MFAGSRFAQNYFAQGAKIYSLSTHTITKSLEYTVKRTPSALTKSLKYTVKATPAALTKSLKYTVKKAVSVTKSLEYTVKTTPSVITKSLKYAVKTTPSAITKSLEYTVKKGMSLTKSLKYTIKTSGQLIISRDGGFGSIYFGHNYFGQTYTAVTQNIHVKRLSLAYEIKIQGIVMTKQLKYMIKTTRVITKSLTYHVSPIVKKTLKYTIKTHPVLTKQLEYTIHNAGLAIKKSLTYTISIGGYIDFYNFQNTQFATNDLYVKQNTTFTNLY